MSTKLTFNEVVNTLTNNRRNRWAKAGYPGLRKKDPKGPLMFAGKGLIEAAEKRKAEKLKGSLK